MNLDNYCKMVFSIGSSGGKWKLTCNSQVYFPEQQEITASLQSSNVNFQPITWPEKDRLNVSLMLLLIWSFLTGLKLSLQYKQDLPEGCIGSFGNENNNTLKYFYWSTLKKSSLLSEFQRSPVYISIFKTAFGFIPVSTAIFSFSFTNGSLAYRKRYSSIQRLDSKKSSNWK